MFVSFVAHLLSAWFAFLLPCYASFKALSHRPVSEPDLERWVMYWSVLGALIAVEYTAEWLVSWFPFYWETKTLFLLFLALPQTQGSTYIYKTYLEPFFTKNEAEIDAGIESAKNNILVFAKDRLRVLADLLFSLLSKTPAAGQPPSAGAGSSQPGEAVNPVQVVQDLWRSYGPLVAGMLSRASASASPGTQPAPSPAPYSTASVASASSTSFQPPNQSTPSLSSRQSDYMSIPEAKVPLPATPDARPGSSYS